MVQIDREVSWYAADDVSILYIPHGSDWPFKGLFLYSLFVYLYIPHGSDWTRREYILSSICHVFISHMVQIEQE